MATTMTFYVDENLARLITLAAKVHDRSVSAEIREALRAHVYVTQAEQREKVTANA